MSLVNLKSHLVPRSGSEGDRQGRKPEHDRLTRQGRARRSEATEGLASAEPGGPGRLDTHPPADASMPAGHLPCDLVDLPICEDEVDHTVPGVGAEGPASLVQYSHSPSTSEGEHGGDVDISFPFGCLTPALPSPESSSPLSCPARLRWSRQQKRVYQESMSYLTFWQAHGYMVLWVMLSSAVPGGLQTLTRDFQRLREEIERKLGFRGMEFLAVKTREGNGVIHGYLAWKGPRVFYLPQRWLSHTWERIHGAPYVWVSKVKLGKGHRSRLSRYIVSQYLAGQGALVRVSSSSKRTFGFGLRRVWAEFRKGALPAARVPLWSAFLAGERIMFGNGDVWSLDSVRAGWPAWSRER